MNRLINKLAGGEKAATPARRAVVIAAMVTALLLVISLVTLAVTSIVFSMTDAEPEVTEPVGDSDGEGDISKPLATLEYTTLEDYDAVVSKFEKLVSGKTLADRTIEGNNIYYAYQNPSEIKLSSGALNASHSMLVDFSKNNKTLKTDKNAADCNIPLVKNVTNNGASFEIVVYTGEKSIHNNQTYSWIYTNAYKYGFVYSENTFTYVGVVAAQYARANNASLDKLSALASVNVTEAGKQVTYQLYYTAEDANEHKVPSNYEYSVYSMNGGYVVTVNMSKKVNG